MNGKIIEFVVQSISTSVMNLLIFLFFNRVYKPKYNNKSLYILAYIITTTAFISITYISSRLNIAIINTVYLFVYINILCVLLFNITLRKSFMYNSLYALLMFFADVLTVSFWSILKGEDFESILSNSQYLSISCITNILIMFWIWMVFVTIISKKETNSIKYKQIMLMCFFIIFSVFVEYSFAVRIRNNKDGIITLIILLGFLIFGIMIVYLTNEITKSYITRQEAAIIQKQGELQLEHYTEMNKKYEEARKVIHDIKKHLAVLNSMRCSDSRVEDYGRVIEHQVDSLFEGFQCSNRILSIIMSQKITIAESENITVNTNVEDLLFECVSDLDITAIFANLWDNAIEACRKVDQENRFINIIAGKVNEFIVISFENSFDGYVCLDEKTIRSSKEEHDGVGLSIIKNAVEKYEGVFNTEYNEKVFKSEVILPIH